MFVKGFFPIKKIPKDANYTLMRYRLTYKGLDSK